MPNLTSNFFFEHYKWYKSLFPLYQAELRKAAIDKECAVGTGFIDTDKELLLLLAEKLCRAEEEDRIQSVVYVNGSSDPHQPATTLHGALWVKIEKLIDEKIERSILAQSDAIRRAVERIGKNA